MESCLSVIKSYNNKYSYNMIYYYNSKIFPVIRVQLYSILEGSKIQVLRSP